MVLMSPSASLGNPTVVMVSFTGLQLYPGAGVHRAALTATINPGQGMVGVAVELHCEVHLREAPRLWLGDASAEQAVLLNTFQLNDQLYFPISDEQINAIESKIDSSDLNLDLRLRGRIITAEGRERFEYSGQTPLLIRRSEWLNQLSNLERSSAFTVGVLAPTGNSGLATIVGHLRDAERLYNTKEYPSAAVEIRKILEIIGKLTPNLPTEQHINSNGRPQDRSPAARWAMLYHAALRIAHMAPHSDPISASVTWRREDVQTLLAFANGIAAQIATDAWPSFSAGGTQP